MVEAVISGFELSVLDITQEVLREDRVAFPEAVGEVDAAAGTALAAGIVPVEFPIEPEVTARQEVAADVTEAEIGIEPEEVVGSLLPARAGIPESRVEDRGRILARRQVRA